MFCPNCGTQNPDTSTSCTKCGFNLKPGNAPKFKGTMLMMNTPQAAAPTPPSAPPPAAPPPVAPPIAAAPPPAAPPAKPNIKGTMVGLAPGFGAQSDSAPPAMAPMAAAPPMAPPPAAPSFGGPPLGSPPAAADSNKAAFAGTMVAPAGMSPFGGGGAPPPPPAPFGGAPNQGPPQGFGGPPPGAAPAPFAPPPQQFGAPLNQGFGGPPPASSGFGPPPPGALPGSFGGPPMGAPQAPGMGMQAPQQDFAALGGAMMASATSGATPGQKRNPIVMLAMTLGAIIVANVVGGILTSVLDSIGGAIAGLLSLGAVILYCVTVFKQVKELRMYLGTGEPPAWTFLLPFFKVPDAMGEAKRRAGCAKPEANPVWMYFIIPAYALQVDLNQLWDPQSRG